MIPQSKIPHAVLCYIDEIYSDERPDPDGPYTMWAWFTTKPLNEQWGDDWDDAPYEHNAGRPYGPCRCYSGIREDGNWESKSDYYPNGEPRWRIYRVPFATRLWTPQDIAGMNSHVSVEQINVGIMPWLCDPDARSQESACCIRGGIEMERFIARLETRGESVGMPQEVTS